MRARTVLTLSMAMVLIAGFTGTAHARVPVQPGNATPDMFIPSAGCGCHGSLVQQWSASMHARAIVDPVFLAKVAEAEAEAGEEVAIFCKRCHAPVGNMTGDFDGTGSDVAREGVACMFCHQVVGIGDEIANVAHLLEPDLTRRAQLEDPQAPHPAEYSTVHPEAEICGGCHNVNHPTNGTHLETSYSEWAASPYASEGVVCQDCHMSAQAGVVGPSSGSVAAGGPQRDNVYAMTFVGGNVGQGPADESRALLQSAATVSMDLPDIVSPSTTASFTVTITNKGAGHYLPTGLTEVREMWLRVYAEMEDGTTAEIGERHFGTMLEDAEGNYPAEMWKAVAVHSDDRIPPRESVSESYSFAMPADAERSTVVAVLNYRSMPDELAEKAGVENPVTEMAFARTTVYASQEAKAGSTDGSTEESGVQFEWWYVAVGVAALAAVALAVVLRRSRKKD